MCGHFLGAERDELDLRVVGEAKPAHEAVRVDSVIIFEAEIFFVAELVREAALEVVDDVADLRVRAHGEEMRATAEELARPQAVRDAAVNVHVDPRRVPRGRGDFAGRRDGELVNNVQHLVEWFTEANGRQDTAICGRREAQSFEYAHACLSPGNDGTLSWKMAMML